MARGGASPGQDAAGAPVNAGEPGSRQVDRGGHAAARTRRAWRPAGALLAGAVAGAAAALIDGVWSWSGLGQFAPSFGARVRALVFLAASSALAAAIAVGVLAALVAGLARVARLGESHPRQPAPRSLAALSRVLAGVPLLAVCLWAAYAGAVSLLATRKHFGLVVASTMGLTLAGIAAAALGAIVLAGPVAVLLGRLARGPRASAGLRSRRAPWVAAIGLVSLGAAIAAIAARSTLSLLPLRPVLVALLAAALLAPSWRIGVGRAAWLSGRRAAVRRAAIPLLLVGLAAIALWAGAADGARAAAVARTGWGGPLARALRSIGDLDRDGYSRFLGGGDCDDGDRGVHPGAVEVPDDHVDNNCVGGDATLRPEPPAPFAAVPPSVPSDLGVLLLTIDTLRADHMGAYGYARATTPRLDRLAGEGSLFRNAWAHAPSTRYSIPAILTGRYPLDVLYADIPGQWPGLADDNVTIAEVLRGRGRATGAVLNYWYFEKRRRMDQGFDEYDNTNARLHKGIAGEGPARTRGTSSREQTDKAIALLDRLSAGPFFLWVHYYDPHADYEPPAGAAGFGTRPVDRYDGEIRHTDEQIGRLLDELGRRGLDRRTAVVVTGDHGEGFGEHGIDMHGYHLYAPQTRVPLIVRVPGIPAREVTTPVGHVDILPTLANLVGAEPVPDTAGRSLVGLMTGATRPDEDRVVFQELSYEGNNEMRAAASKACHVIYNVSPHSSWEVYEIDRDPGELHDRSGDPDACRQTREALAAWYDRSALPAGAADAVLPGRPAIARPLDVDCGSEVRLLAVDLPRGPVAPGASFPVTYTFEARSPLEGGWKVFAHFENEAALARFQGDHEPPRPIAWWRAGQFIRYTRQVTVPRSAKAGRYKAWVGLFRRAERRPASSRTALVVDDRAVVGSIEVRR